MIENRNVKYDETFVNDDFNEITFYFTADKDILKDFNLEVPEQAVHAELSLTLPFDTQDVNSATVQISPTREIATDIYEDFDWQKVYLSKDEIEELVKISREF